MPNSATNVILQMNAKLFSKFCVATLLAFATMHHFFWKHESGLQFSVIESASDWANGGDNAVRKLKECRSMFEISSDEKRVSHDTEYYEDLSVTLPFHPRYHGASQSPSGIPGSRVLNREDTYPHTSLAGAKLPYLPCQLQEYGPDLSLDCMKAKLGHGRKLWIMFAGDSKIRNTFFAFLNLTRSMDYNISYLNTSGTFEDVMSKLESIRWKDFDAVSKVNPNLRVTLRFCVFQVSSLSTFEYRKDVQLLKRMASGPDPVPDILVTAYSTWTLGLMDMGEIIPSLSTFDLMNEGLRRLVPLLHRISLRTRVLVLSESRVKPFALHESHLRQFIFSDSNIEWGNMMFFHYLQEIEGSEVREGRSPSGPPAKRDWLKADSEGLWWWDSLLPHGLAVRAVCAELHARNLTLTPQYGRLGCTDTNHDGETTLQLGATMLLNLMCNAAINLNVDNACCQ
ncbi:uncharacterized protein LOC122258550 [Penaeus japonicus]|uniref:uncharacterized protein LOC122258550 n=1 Tax=Penaeus japonicus TaxID=27405 RepID=UPI001C70D30B|nr:uncharacterized protein LOC122258550 [Penaeus japonicus]